MKRLIITLAAIAALAVAMPAGVLAKHHGHHGKRHGHHARLLRFGSLSTSNTTGTTGPTGPTGPSGPQTGDTAGTVDSFNGTKLVIKLNDGSTVTGNVTNATEIECEAPEHAGATGDDDSTEGVDNDDAQGDENGQQPSTTTPQAHESDNGESGDDNDDNGADESTQSACGTAALTPGTVVKEAELLVGPGGSVFHSVHLIK